MFKIIFFLLVYISNLCFASSLYKVQLSYMDTIDNDDYVGEIELLRDDVWLKDNNIDNIGDTINISLLEFGILNINAKVDGLDLHQESTRADKANNKVTGLFKRYTKEVFTYKFKDISNNKIISLNTTPNHRFYVINRDEYEEISAITQDDLLLSQTGEKVKLICDVSVNVGGCAVKYNKDDRPTLVYNMEVENIHRYYVGSERGILVHNMCGGEEKNLYSNHSQDSFPMELNYAKDKLNSNQISFLIPSKNAEIYSFLKPDRIHKFVVNKDEQLIVKCNQLLTPLEQKL